MGDVESKLGSIGKTKEELNGVQVDNLPELFLDYVIVWLFLSYLKASSFLQSNPTMLAIQFYFFICKKNDITKQ